MELKSIVLIFLILTALSFLPACKFYKTQNDGCASQGKLIDGIKRIYKDDRKARKDITEGVKVYLPIGMPKERTILCLRESSFNYSYVNGDENKLEASLDDSPLGIGFPTYYSIHIIFEKNNIQSLKARSKYQAI